MSKNKKVMSIAIMPDLHEELKRYSKRKGMSTSAYVGELIEQAVKLNIDDDPVVFGKPIDEDIKMKVVKVHVDETPVVIKVPLAYKSDPEKLQKWLTIQMNGILKAITKLD